MPLILSSIDGEFPQTEAQRSTRELQLAHIKEATLILTARYDVADDITNYIVNITSFLQVIERPSILRAKQKGLDGLEKRALQQWRNKDRITSWSELCLSDPRIYLRLSKLLDYTLSHGRYPHEGEICTLFTKLGIDIKPCSQLDLSGMWPGASMTVLLQNNAFYLAGRGGRPPPVQVGDMSEESTADGTIERWPSESLDSVRGNRRSTSPANSHDNDQLTEFIWSTLGIPGSFSNFCLRLKEPQDLPAPG